MKIGLIGTYDIDNFGDCMFPELYESILKRNLSNVTVSLYSPTNRAAQILSYRNIRSLPQDSDHLEFEEDALILTGGETIGCGHSSGIYIFPRHSFSGGLRLWCGPALASGSSNVRFIAHCVGANSCPDEVVPAASRILATADLVTFRDDLSLNRFSEHANGFTSAVDPMFLISDLLSNAEWEKRARDQIPAPIGPGDYFVAQISAEYAHSNLDVWVNEIHKISEMTGKTPVLLPICHFLYDDIILERASKALSSRGCSNVLFCNKINVKDTAAIIGASAGYVGTSLHGAVTAVSFGLPLAVYSRNTHSKHEGTLRKAGVVGATTHCLSKLSTCFEHMSKKPMNELQVNAKRLAERDIQIVINSLKGARAKRPQPKTHDISSMIRADRKSLHRAQVLLRRIGFSALRTFPSLYDSYKRTRLRRRVRLLNMK